MADQAPRVAIVTGGSRGIGRAICLSLAGAGCDIVVNYRRDEGAALSAVEQIIASGRRAIAVSADVGDPDACEGLVSMAVDRLGPPSILVHNGGIASSGLAVAEATLEELERVMRTHAFGAFQLAKLCVPFMAAQERGDIVMLSSVVTDSLPAGGAPYNMAKAAVEALAMTLAKEVQRDGIHVNVVAPGLVATDMGDRLTRAITDGQAKSARDLDATFPFGHVCTPEDVASVVAFLVSPGAAYVSGTRIRVDGGGSGYGS